MVDVSCMGFYTPKWKVLYNLFRVHKISAPPMFEDGEISQLPGDNKFDTITSYEALGNSERCAWYGDNGVCRPSSGRMEKQKMVSVYRTDGRMEQVPFFFDRKVSLIGNEHWYIKDCLKKARNELIRLQNERFDWDCNFYGDRRNALTLYIILLNEILDGKVIRYYAILNPAVCMAAYLGQNRMLKIFVRNGIDITSIYWGTIDVQLAAVLGDQIRLFHLLIDKFPELLSRTYVLYGDVGGFCAGYGSLRFLRDLRRHGISLKRLFHAFWQDGDSPQHMGSALLLAVQMGRKSIVNDLIAHDEFCDWRNLVNWEGRPLSLFKQAVLAGQFTVARLYHEKGWLNIPKNEEEMLTILVGTESLHDVRKFKFLKSLFSQFDFSEIACRHRNLLGPEVCRFCGYDPQEGCEPEQMPAMNASDKQVRQLVRLLEESKSQNMDAFPYEEWMNEDCLPKELHTRYRMAFRATGRKARELMDDPEIDPNCDVIWNWPFASCLGRRIDWPTFKGWLLRGMEIYSQNLDDPGDVPLHVSREVLCHLLVDLEYRPWMGFGC